MARHRSFGCIPQGYQVRYNTIMYPSSYRRLWHPGHGINFGMAGLDSTSRSQAEVRHTMHTTSTAASLTAAEAGGSQCSLSDDDAPFFTASEYQSGSDAENSVQDQGAEVLQTKDVAAPVDGSKTADGPPVTNLDFQLALHKFQEAKSAPRGHVKSYYSHMHYLSVAEDGTQDRVKVHYCRSNHTMERVCQYFLEDEVLGFDLEWSPDAKKSSSPRKNISLIQIANQSRVALFHVALFPEKAELVSPTFRRIMENADVLKVGVAIKADCTRLRTHLGVDTAGIFELSHLYKLVKYSKNGHVNLINKRLVPLAVQVEEHLGLPMFKGQDVRSSDWSKPLNSATDAYAGFQLFHVLEGERNSLEPTPPRPYRVELNLPIRVADRAGVPIPNENAEVIDTEESEETSAAPTSGLEASADSIPIVETAPEPSTDRNNEDGVLNPHLGQSSPSPEPTSSHRPHAHALVLAAEKRAKEYVGLVGQLPRVPHYFIRIFFLWRDNPDLTPEKIAALLRESPLPLMWVLQRIMDVGQREELEFDSARMREEVIRHVPEETLRAKYKKLLSRLNGKTLDT
ncbi:Werner syndrome ATP-dependent helicase-like protein [Colletotrichum spinosum]|uniref:Werner syndrome ATP-dependent helicase-like protein n=1 Tax=Colletotrichum spinosum TaxID=1347390 RepID=A0A4R8PL02_9PEZI|nr:Werner syndrome ATP-dependent helicase-like protein [Colletotrichum spinosum]